MHYYLRVPVFLLASALFSAGAAWGNVTTRLCRVDLSPHPGYTRILLKLDGSANCSVDVLPGKRARLTLRETTSPTFKKFRTYQDKNVGGFLFARHGDDLRITFAVSDDEPGIRLGGAIVPGVVAVDVGPRLKRVRQSGIVLGREPILNGFERFLRDFEHPLRADVSFMPSDLRMFQKSVPAAELKLFQKAEGSLYKGNAADAETVFAYFASRETPLKGIAAARLGEACYVQRKYREALQAFRTAVMLAPDFATGKPALALFYADSLIREGDYQQGRRILNQLITSSADKQSAPMLLVRLADILARLGKEREAVILYQTIERSFPAHKSSRYAALKLADRRLFTVGDNFWQDLQQVYQSVYAHGGDLLLKEEALFKSAFLQALYGPAADAVASIAGFEKKYPQSVYSSIAHSIREELLLPLSQEYRAARNHEGLVRMALENRGYLSRCFTDGSFAGSLAEGFAVTGRLQEEVILFSELADREWTMASAAFLLLRVVVDGDSLLDYAHAEGAGANFLQRFPRHPDMPLVREHLAGIAFHQKDYSRVNHHLAWLAEKGRKAEIQESYYYAGKALLGAGNYQAAALMVERYIGEQRKKGATSPCIADAYLVAVASRIALRDYPGALTCCQEGLAQVTGDNQDPFVYKSGEILLRMGQQAAAMDRWEELIRTGRDPFWKKMAEQGLADIAWRQKVAAAQLRSK